MQVNGFLRNKPALEALEPIVAWDPPPVYVSGYSKLRDGWVYAPQEPTLSWRRALLPHIPQRLCRHQWNHVGTLAAVSYRGLESKAVQHGLQGCYVGKPIMDVLSDRILLCYMGLQTES